MFRIKVFMTAIVGVLALSGYASAVAPATEAGWMVNGTRLTGTAAVSTTAAVDKEIEATAGQVKINCKGKTLNGKSAKISSASQMVEVESLEFTSCVGNTVCPLAESQKETINTLPVLVDLTLDGSKAVKGRVLPANTSKVFASVAFEGAECSFSGTNDVTGTQAFLAPAGQEEKGAQQFNAITETAGELKLASSAVTVTGSTLVKLTSGLPYSFL